MSGLDEILVWAIQNFDPADYETEEDWYNAVSADFEANGRNPLDYILEDDKQTFLDAFYISFNDNEEIQTFIDER